MAGFEFNNVNIKGIYTSVSEEFNFVDELGANAGLSKEDVDKFQITTGVNKLHSRVDLTTSDYCIHAAEQLLKDLDWSRSSVDAIIFLTQTPDYILPKTSVLIQKKLQLKEDLFVLDINDGCSGFIYGLITAFQFSSSRLKRILLMVGETPSKIVNKMDKSSNLLFGDGGACIAVEYDENNKVEYLSNGVDGNGYESIIISDGGFRNVTNVDSLKDRFISDGITRNSLNLQMKGEDVFLFGISKVPKEIKFFLEHYSVTEGDFDYFIMHQANLKMNEMIVNKLRIDKEKVLYSIKEFGNTSSLSIPLTVTVNKQLLSGRDVRILISGFGVGLSWGTGLINLSESTLYKNLKYA